MGSTMTIKGSFAELFRDLNNINELIKWRKRVGFKLFEPDEVWDYIPIHDSRLCPVCKDFGTRTYRGDEIPTLFPYGYMVGFAFFYPNVHDIPKFDWLQGRCRCRMRLRNVAETMERRLHREKLAVVGQV